MQGPPEIPRRPDRLDEAVRVRRERRALAERDRGRPIGRDLALIGAIGWTIIVPTLLGIFIGRWLDRRVGSGLLWTLGLLFAGLTVGCALAWQRVNRS